ncbi:MAG: cytochrome c biogenesis protein CcsA [Bacteroidota bacterium]
MNTLLRANWWKVLAVLLVFYAIIMGFLGQVPHLPILHETIRNLYFHVAMWFGMMILMIVNLVYGIRYLYGSSLKDDVYAEESALTAMYFGVAGLITGMIWANYTWGAPWVNDPQLNGAAGSMLAYAAYFILRNAVTDEHRRAKLSAIYSVFAFVMMIVFIQILPKMTDTLHPGRGGNPGFNTYDLDSSMRWIFYPSVIGWTLMGTWIMSLRIRIKLAGNK